MSNKPEFILFIAFVIAVRLAELFVAKRNEAWLRKQGAIEYGQEHYPFIVTLHSLFIASMIIEFFSKEGHVLHPLFLVIFLLLIALKAWVISLLGKYWNTRILRVPNSVFIKKGPYKYFKHPNYFIVICEIVIIPLAFGLYYTAIIFSILNLVMLMVRIRVEEKVWD